MLEIKNLHVKFHTRDREAVSGVSLTIRDGEIVGLVGESGSGKSVTAMSVAGLLPRKQCAYSGQILLDGAELLLAGVFLEQVVLVCVGPVGSVSGELPHVSRPSGKVGEDSLLRVLNDIYVADVRIPRQHESHLRCETEVHFRGS